MRLFFLLLLAAEASARADQRAPTSIKVTGRPVPTTRRGQPKPEAHKSGEPNPASMHTTHSKACRRGTGIVQRATDLTITALRIGTCALCVHHGIDKLDNVEVFTANVVAKSFAFMPGSPKLWTYAAAAAQILGPVFLGLGLFSRPAALSMSGTMVAAVAFHVRNTGLEGFPLGVPASKKYNYELGGLYLLVLFYFTAAGAGPFSVDEKILGGELNFYKGALARIRGRRAVSE